MGLRARGYLLHRLQGLKGVGLKSLRSIRMWLRILKLVFCRYGDFRCPVIAACIDSRTWLLGNQRLTAQVSRLWAKSKGERPNGEVQGESRWLAPGFRSSKVPCWLTDAASRVRSRPTLTDGLQGCNRGSSASVAPSEGSTRATHRVAHPL